MKRRLVKGCLYEVDSIVNNVLSLDYQTFNYFQVFLRINLNELLSLNMSKVLFKVKLYRTSKQLFQSNLSIL